MKREARALLAKAGDSLVLAIEHFNRPSDRGRVSTVLILLDHAFEMLLKASLVHRDIAIREKEAAHTIGFDACVRKGFSHERRFLEQDEVLLLQAVNALRDAAQHHLVDVSEELLYVKVQAGVTLFRTVLKRVFDEDIAEHLPKRVLPVSTVPPLDLDAIFATQVDEVKKLLGPGRRRVLDATAKLRSLAIVEGAVTGASGQPAEEDLARLAKRLRAGAKWSEVFSGVASLQLTSSGVGPSLDLRVTKRGGLPVTVVSADNAGDGPVLAIRRVNELDFYNLSFTQLKDHLKVTQPKLTALIRHLNVESDLESCKVFQIGGVTVKRYSQKALDRLTQALKTVDLAEVHRAHGQWRARDSTG